MSLYVSYPAEHTHTQKIYSSSPFKYLITTFHLFNIVWITTWICPDNSTLQFLQNDSTTYLFTCFSVLFLRVFLIVSELWKNQYKNFIVFYYWQFVTRRQSPFQILKKKKTDEYLRFNYQHVRVWVFKMLD